MTKPSRSLSRRAMLKLMGTTGGALLLAACAPTETGDPAAPASGNVDAGDPGTGTAGETVVLMYNANEISEPELAQFEETYGYDIEFIETDITKLFASLAAGTPIDCFRIYGTNTPALALRGIPLDLTEYFNTSEIVPTADLLPVNDLYVVEGAALRHGQGLVAGLLGLCQHGAVGGSGRGAARRHRAVELSRMA